MATILADCPECHRKQGNNHKKCISCGLDLDRAKQSRRVMYWIQYRVQGIQRLEKIGYSIEKARAAKGKREGQIYENVFDPGSILKLSFSDLTEWFLPIEETKVLSGQITETYLKIKKIHLNTFNSIFGDMTVNAIAAADLDRYKAERKREGKSDSYVDQELGSVASMIGTAFENEKVSAKAYKVFRARKRLMKKKSANARDQVLSYRQYNKLFKKLPQHSKAIVVMAFWTGMRRGEILSLTWDKVDLKNRIIRLESADTKERKPKVVPISRTLKKVLADLPDRLRSARKSNHVFLFKGRPVSDIRDAIMRGCKDAGIPYGRNRKDGFTFHDLRHTFATNARRAGIPRNLIITIMGHSDANDMNLRYDRIDQEDLIEAIDRLENFLRPKKVNEKIQSNKKSDSK